MELGRFLSGFGRQRNDDAAMPESERSESVREEAVDALDARPTDQSRVPPGQWITRGWPVLTYGSTPRFDPARWDLRIVGLVENPLTWDYDTFMGLPTKKVLCDIHCVTTWSLLDNVFEGVPALHVAEEAKSCRMRPTSSPTPSRAIPPTCPWRTFAGRRAAGV